MGGRAGRSWRFAGGAVFGFVLAAAFMRFGYAGAAPLVHRLPGFAVFGFVGAGCAVILALGGRALAARVDSRRFGRTVGR